MTRSYPVAGCAILLLAIMAACSSGDAAVSSSEDILNDPSARGVGATPTLDGVRRKGFVRCGVTTGVAGFSAPDAQGEWRGLDVDVCRAIAAAVLGDASKVRFTPLSAGQRFTALQTGEIDVLSRITTITFQREAQLGIEFPAINWYDGTSFIVHKSLHVTSVDQLDGATICVQPVTSNQRDVTDYFRRKHLKFTPVVIERLEEATAAYFAHRCDAFTQDLSTLAAVKARAPDPEAEVILPDVISKAPYGPGVMPNDIRWMRIVRWSVYAMINAEELGLSAATIDGAKGSDDPSVQRFLGTAGDFGSMLGLNADWAYQIVKQVGNYADSFDRNLKPLGVARGVNRLWTDGGVLYVPALQ